MKALLLAALTAVVLSGCANRDPYQDPMYTLQRDLYHRNQKWDQAMERTYMRNQARDQRYNSWFNAVME
jgi:outer membrane lipoprotein SlyB